MLLNSGSDFIKDTEKFLPKNLFISKNLIPLIYKKFIAFTLAEVLVTLLIIGVIGSLTIPAIINDTKEAEYNVAVKKIYAELSKCCKK